jgi:hypothetical protein
MPRYSQALIERLDVTVGGQQITASNTDYGALYTLLRDQLTDGGGKKPFSEPQASVEDGEAVSNILHLFDSYTGAASNQGKNLCAATVANGNSNSFSKLNGVPKDSSSGNPWDIQNFSLTGATPSAITLDATYGNHTVAVVNGVNQYLYKYAAAVAAPNLPPLVPGAQVTIALVGATPAGHAGTFTVVASNREGFTVLNPNQPTALTALTSGTATPIALALPASLPLPAYDGQAWRIPSGKTTPYLQKAIVWQGLLGFSGGKFARFIDTSITGSIELRIRLAPLAVTYGAVSPWKGALPLAPGQTSSYITNRAGDYYISNMYMIMDTISFTDDFYRQMVASRLIQGGSIVIPFDNYFSVQKQIGLSDTVTFNIATQSLDYLIGTLRRGDYNATPSTVGFLDGAINGEIMQQMGSFGSFVEDAEGVLSVANSAFPAAATGSVSSASMNPFYYSFISGAPTDYLDGSAPSFQWLVANNMIPTWPADVNDVWTLNQASLDLANSITNTGNTSTTFEFRRGKFAHITCFNHHAETEKFISGLDTRGASSNMYWSVQGLAANAYDPKTQTTFLNNYQAMVWAAVTSTIEISAGQNITIIF